MRSLTGEALYTADTPSSAGPLPLGYTWREAEVQFEAALRQEAENRHCDGGAWDGLKGCHLQIVGPVAVFAMEDHDTIPARAVALSALADTSLVARREADGATRFEGVEAVGLGDRHFRRVAHHKLAYALSDLFGRRLDPSLATETLGE